MGIFHKHQETPDQNIKPGTPADIANDPRFGTAAETETRRRLAEQGGSAALSEVIAFDEDRGHEARRPEPPTSAGNPPLRS